MSLRVPSEPVVPFKLTTAPHSFTQIVRQARRLETNRLPIACFRAQLPPTAPAMNAVLLLLATFFAGAAAHADFLLVDATYVWR